MPDRIRSIERDPGDEIRRGWPIMIVCFFGTLTSVVAMPFYIIGPITPSLQSEFAWDRTSVVAATAFLQLGLVFGMPLSGRLIDRYGGRRVALVSYLLTVSVFIALAIGLRSLPQIYAAYLVLGAGCAGASTVPFTLLIGKWFAARRGVALGIALAGTGLASFIAPNLAQAVGSALGWRAVLLAVAAFLALGIPVVLLGYREPPVRRAASIPVADGAETPTARTGLRQLMADGRFVLLAVILAMGGAFISSMVVHFVPMLVDAGVTPVRAAHIASLNGLAMICGRLTIGWLLDRYPAVWLGTAMFLIAAGGCIIFVLGGPPVAPLMVIAMGFMIGAEIDLLSYLVLRYFRITDYGLIYGYLYATYMIGATASPWAMGYLIGRSGYDFMFMAAATMFAFIALLFPILDRLKAGPVGRSSRPATAA